MPALFDEKSTSALSAPFFVTADQIAIISAFGFTGEQRGVIEKVRWRLGTMPQGEVCGKGGLCTPAGIIGAEDVTQCGQWVVNACQNLVLLTVPGSYRLRLDEGVVDPDADPEPGDPTPVLPISEMGTIYVDLTMMDRKLASSIPEHLILGFISPQSGCK